MLTLAGTKSNALGRNKKEIAAETVTRKIYNTWTHLCRGKFYSHVLHHILCLRAIHNLNSYRLQPVKKMAFFPFLVVLN